MSDKPHFLLPVRQTLVNYHTNEPFWLESVEELTSPEEDSARIVEICNQPSVYRLFAEKLEGKPYTLADAAKFLTWGYKGWIDQSHFVFFVRSDIDEIVGALDIKSADCLASEVGYWVDERVPGIATNALVSMLHQAREAGYRRVFALILPENERSKGVVLRAGFKAGGQMERNGKMFDRFDATLQNA
jgi:RimJ/RimL family protein N-acetyltransferase